MREREKKVPLRNRIKRLAFPSPKVIWLVGLLISVSIVISWLLYKWNPNLPLAQIDQFISVYIALWQVHTGVAAVALPILLFVIELSKDQRQAATRSHEVLISETLIFPIIVFSLAGSIRIGLDLALFPRPILLVVDFVFIYLVVLVLTVYAYYTALSLLFSPSRMKAKAMALMKAKMSESLDESIELRFANNRLFELLKRLKVGYWPSRPDPRESERYLILNAAFGGTLADIHLNRLEDFIRSLPWKERPATLGVGADPEIEEEKDEGSWADLKETIWFMKQYGERVTKNNLGLMRLKRDAFTALDRDSLEKRLTSVVRLRGQDED